MNKKLAYVVAGLALTFTFDVARAYYCAYVAELGRAKGSAKGSSRKASGELA
nr:hypothetical protein [Pseudomonas oleovorans]